MTNADNTNEIIGTAESNIWLQQTEPGPEPEPTPEQPVDSNTGGSGNIATGDEVLIIGLVLALVVVFAVVMQIICAKFSKDKQTDKEE